MPPKKRCDQCGALVSSSNLAKHIRRHNERQRREDAENRAALSAVEVHRSPTPLHNRRVDVPRNTTPPKFRLAKICRATKKALQLHGRAGISLRTLPTILRHVYPGLAKEDRTMCSYAAVVAYRDARAPWAVQQYVPSELCPIKVRKPAADRPPALPPLSITDVDRSYDSDAALRAVEFFEALPPRQSTPVPATVMMRQPDRALNEPTSGNETCGLTGKTKYGLPVKRSRQTAPWRLVACDPEATSLPPEHTHPDDPRPSLTTPGKERRPVERPQTAPITAPRKVMADLASVSSSSDSEPEKEGSPAPRTTTLAEPRGVRRDTTAERRHHSDRGELVRQRHSDEVQQLRKKMESLQRQVDAYRRRSPHRHDERRRAPTPRRWSRHRR